MTNAYRVCTSCRCFIKVLETICPFCEVRVEVAPTPLRVVARMSRAKWLAFGSALALVRCSDSAVTTEPIADAASSETEVHEASSESGSSDGNTAEQASLGDASLDVVTADSANDAASDVGALDGLADPDILTSDVGDITASDMAPGDDADVETGDASGTDDVATSDAVDGDVLADAVVDVPSDGNDAGPTFTCAHYLGPSYQCKRNEEYCVVIDPTLPSSGEKTRCIAYDGDSSTYGPYPARCMPTPTCACLRTVWTSSFQNIALRCGDDMLGAVSLSYAPCYGCPPARWERLA